MSITFNESENNLIQHKLSILRNIDTKTPEFRTVARELGLLLAAEVFADIDLLDKPLTTPVTNGYSFPMIPDDFEVVIIPVLRAGTGIANPFLEVYPMAKQALLGMYRDEETHEPQEYYSRLPDFGSSGRKLAVITDPMVATGGSAINAIEQVMAKDAVWIKYVSWVMAPEAKERLIHWYIDEHRRDDVYIQFYTVAFDEKLNDDAYIVPGLGDAGDRLYGI